MTIKAILFDKDGTLIDVNGTWVPFYKDVLKSEQGLDAAAVEEKMVAAGFDPLSQTFRAGSMLAGGTTRQMVELWWQGESPDRINALVKRLDHDFAPLALQHLKPLLSLAPVLDALAAAGFALGVATNDGELSARKHMTALGVADRFAAIIGADSVAVPKPSGEMVKHFAQVTGLEPRQIAMVGDNHHDMEEARNGGAGMAIGVLSGNGGRDDLAPHANHVLHSVADLPALFRDL